MNNPNSYNFRQALQFDNDNKPNFLKMLTQPKEVQNKESERPERDDEAPQVIIPDSLDLTKNQVDQILGKRSRDEDPEEPKQPEVKTEKKAPKAVKIIQSKKVKNKNLLSFDDD